MTKIVIELENCSKCHHFEATPYPTEDSWERPANWWCKHPDWKGLVGKPNFGYTVKDAKFIAGYIEWTDEKHQKVPNWCPIKIEE